MSENEKHDGTAPVPVAEGRPGADGHAGCGGTAGADRHGAASDDDLGGPHDGPHGYASDKEAYLNRMRRVEGQVRGIARMIDKDAYCIDVLTQVAAVTKALQAVSLALVEDHLGHCVVDAARASDDEAAAKVREASEAIGRLVRM